MKILFKNIRELIQVRSNDVSFVAGAEMKELPSIKEAFLLIEDGLIADFGSMSDLSEVAVDKTIDASGKMILPSWCDSHTHIVYAGNREGEFVDRLNGLTYEEIAARGGGIINSAKKLQATSEEELFIQSKERLEDVMRNGTGAIEVKSGYGLSVEGELKMLRVIKRLKESYQIPIKATFLGAHALPENFKMDKQGYLKLLVEDLLPVIAKEKLAEYIDVFCEEGYFSVDDTELILKAGKQYGLKPKVHVNQFNAIGGVQVSVKYDALSVDHLEVMRAEDIESLKNTSTMPVALPACSYFLGISYTPARQMIDEGLPIAIASDYNPGSSPSGNMNFVVSTACIKMKMTPAEAINAATINGAYAMGVEKELGSITRGKRANLIMTQPISSYNLLPYAFGSDLIEQVFVNGLEIKLDSIGNAYLNEKLKPYSLPSSENWKGRETNPDLGVQYWHQAISLYDSEEVVSDSESIELPNISLVGYMCEEGVRRNRGRVGAKHGPKVVRKHLAKMAYHLPTKSVGDFGDVNCIDRDLESCQNNLANLVSEIVKQGSMPIVIGGGHDIAYGHFLGLYDAKKDIAEHVFGIVNFDAHFDLRPVVDKPNSGTPFNQILSEFDSQVKYFVIGIQPSGNTKELYDIAKKNNVQYMESTSCLTSKLSEVIVKLDEFIEGVDSLYVTIDMDGFSSAYAPGVSAPSPFGVEPDFVLAVLDHLLASKKVIACDIAELNPKYDQDNLTANLAARLIDFIARNT